MEGAVTATTPADKRYPSNYMIRSKSPLELQVRLAYNSLDLLTSVWNRSPTFCGFDGQLALHDLCTRAGEEVLGGDLNPVHKPMHSVVKKR